MKKFETPEIELVKFEAMDVVTTSDEEVFEEPSPEEYCI